jgi:hypothetical protein
VAEFEFKVSTSPIATIIGGLGSAIGGIGNAVGGAAKLAGNTIETIGDIAKAGSAAGGDAPDRTVNESNLGLIAAAAQQNIKGKSGGGTLPARKTATKQKPSQNLSTEKLLSIAVKHLSSIDASLKAQMDYTVQATREEAKQEKENDIEGKNNVFTRFADRMKMKASNAAGAAKEKGMGFAQTAAMVAAAALVMKLSSLKPETIERLKKTITEFQDKYKFLFEEVFPILTGVFAGARLGARAGPWGMFIGAIGGGLLAWGWIAQGKADELKNRARSNRDAEKAGATDNLIPNASDDLKKSIGNWIDKRNAYQDIQDEALSRAGGRGIPIDMDRIAKAEKVQKDAYNALIKQMEKEGYTKKQIEVVKEWAKSSTADQAKTFFNDPQNWKKLLKDASEKMADGGDATKANQSGAIPAEYYDVAWNYGRDLKPPKPLTQMTVDEVLAYQKELFAVTKKKSKDGKGHTPAGAFQIVKGTLEGYKKSGLVKGNELFNAEAQDRIAKDIFEKNKAGNLKKQWESLPHSEKGYYKDYTFDQIKKEIAQREVGQTPVSGAAQAIGNTLTALGNVRETFVNALAEQNKNLTPRDPNLTQQMAVDQKANEIRQQAVALENAMRGDAKKEQDRKDAIERMTPGAKLAKANQGKLEALDPNYRTDPNSIIGKYFVHFGLAA